MPGDPRRLELAVSKALDKNGIQEEEFTRQVEELRQKDTHGVRHNSAMQRTPQHLAHEPTEFERIADERERAYEEEELRKESAADADEDIAYENDLSLSPMFKELHLEVVRELLEHYCEQGDVQMCSTIAPGLHFKAFDVLLRDFTTAVVYIDRVYGPDDPHSSAFDMASLTTLRR